MAKRKNPHLDPRSGVSPLVSMPSLPVEAIGIDIGRKGIHLCIPQVEKKPKVWDVFYLDYKENLDWHERLVKLCDGRTHIFAEPTGWHYLAPVASVIVQHTAARLHLVTHSVTGRVRDNYVSTQKTDTTDARALAYIGYETAMIGRDINGVWTYDHELEQHVINLRLLVNSHHKMIAEATRHKNRLKQLAQSMCPLLSMTDTWYTCIHYGAVTPLQILEMEKPEGIYGRSWRYVCSLKEKLYPVEVPESIATNATLNYRQLLKLEESLDQVRQEIERVVCAAPFAPITDRWMTIPKCSLYRCASFHVATHGMAEQYTLEQFKASVGAFPQLQQSGYYESVRSNKKGYRPAMNALQFWAQDLVREKNADDSPIYEYFGGGTKNGGRKWTAAKAKLVRILSAVARSPEGYRPPKGKNHA